MATNDPALEDFGRLLQRFLRQVVQWAEGEELLRKAALGAALEDAGSLVVRDRHLDAALDELLVEGGALTKLLLGAADHPPPTTRASMGWMPGAGAAGGGWGVPVGDG